MYLDMYNKLEVMCDELEDIVAKLSYEEMECGSLRACVDSIKKGMDELANMEQFKEEHDEYFV